MQPLFKTIVAISVFCFFSEKNTAQNLQNLTLENAIALARENKPALRGYAVEEKINAARQSETRLRRGLKLNGTADAQVNPFLPASVIPIGQFNLQNPTDETRAIRFGTWWQASVGLTATLSLLDANVGAQLREQEFQSRLIANSLEEAGTDIVAEVNRAYYGLLLAEEEIRFLESDLKRASVFLTDAEQRQSGGTALPADVNMARLQVNDAQLRLAQAQANRLLARKNLIFRMGLPPERAAELVIGESLTGILNKIEASASDQFDPAAAEQNRPDLRRLVLDNQLQDIKIETEKARLKPTLVAGAFLGLNNLSDGIPLFTKNSWFSNGNLAIRLTVPLSEHWELKKRTLPLTLKQQQNESQLDDLRQQLQFAFQTAYTGFSLAKQQLPIRQSDITLASSNLDLARADYAAGGGLASAITDAEATLKQKQFAWLQTAYNLLLAELDMRLAKGSVQ